MPLRRNDGFSIKRRLQSASNPLRRDNVHTGRAPILGIERIRFYFHQRQVSRVIGKVLFKERCSCETPDYSPYVAKDLGIVRTAKNNLNPSALIISNRGGHARFPTWRLQKAQVRFAVTRDLRIVSREMACYSSRFTLVASVLRIGPLR